MKQAIVLGGAKSGNTVVKLLLAQDYQIIWADDGNIIVEPGINTENLTLIEGGIPMSVGELKVDLVVKNPAIPDSHPVVTMLAERYFIYTETDLAFLYAKNFHYGAITGTNGKTTTTALLDHLLEGANLPHVSCGNIGLPLSEVAFNYQQQEVNIALELSSFQIDGLLFFKPKVATILNLSPDHLDRYYYADNYYDSKFRLLKNMDRNDIFLRNIDDSEIMKRARYLNAQVIDFSLKEKADVYLASNMVFYKDEFLFHIDDLQIKGPHNIQNAMVASMMALILGVPLIEVQRLLKTFKAVEHRLQWVKEVNGIHYVNDSKATNPESTMVALQSFTKPVILLLGGSDKNLSFEGLLKYQDRFKEVIVFGQTKTKLKELLPQAHVVETLSEAVNLATSLAEVNDTVLLSPACASYDQFKNFEHRGETFIQLVNQLNTSN